MFISNFMSKRIGCFPGDLLFAKALWWAVSVIKANYNQEGMATSHVEEVPTVMSEK